MRMFNLKYLLRPNIYIVTIASLCLFGNLAFAQTKADTVTLTSLNGLLGQVIKNNPTQAVYRQQIAAATYNHKASQGYLYPNASASFAGTDNLHLAITPVPGELIGKPGTTYNLQFGKKYVYNTGVTLGYSLFNWQNILQADIAKNNIKLNQVQQEAYEQSLKEQTAKVYFSTLIAKASLKTIKTDEELADSLVNLARQRLSAGTADGLAVNQAVINYNNVEQNKAQSQQLYDQGIESLKILMGERTTTEIKLAENVSLDLLQNEGNAILGSDKGLDVYEQQIQIAGLQSKSQRALAYPTLSALAYFGGQQFRDDFGLSLNNNAWSAYRYLGLNINIPIFTGLANSSKYKSSVAQKNIAQLQYDNARRESEINDRLLIKNNANCLNQAQAAESNFKLYNNSLMLNKQKFIEGVISIDVYLKAFQDYLTAENVYLNNLSQLLSIKATIISRQ